MFWTSGVIDRAIGVVNYMEKIAAKISVASIGYCKSVARAMLKLNVEMQEFGQL